MENNDKSNKIDIKKCTCCYYDIINFEDLNLDILIDQKSFENILVYNISYKTLIGSKPLRITFNKIDGVIRVCDETRYLVLFGAEKYDFIEFIYNRIRYLIEIKSGITYVISHDYAKIKIDSYDSLPLEKNIDFIQCYNIC